MAAAIAITEKLLKTGCLLLTPVSKIHSQHVHNFFSHLHFSAYVPHESALDIYIWCKNVHVLFGFRALWLLNNNFNMNKNQTCVMYVCKYALHFAMFLFDMHSAACILNSKLLLALYSLHALQRWTLRKYFAEKSKWPELLLHEICFNEKKRLLSKIN